MMCPNFEIEIGKRKGKILHIMKIDPRPLIIPNNDKVMIRKGDVEPEVSPEITVVGSMQAPPRPPRTPRNINNSYT